MNLRNYPLERESSLKSEERVPTSQDEVEEVEVRGGTISGRSV